MSSRSSTTAGSITNASPRARTSPGALSRSIPWAGIVKGSGATVNATSGNLFVNIVVGHSGERPFAASLPYSAKEYVAPNFFSKSFLKDHLE